MQVYRNTFAQSSERKDDYDIRVIFALRTDEDDQTLFTSICESIIARKRKKCVAGRQRSPVVCPQKNTSSFTRWTKLGLWQARIMAGSNHSAIHWPCQVSLLHTSCTERINDAAGTALLFAFG